MPRSISRQLSAVGVLRATLSVGGGVRVGAPVSPRTVPDGEALWLGAMDSLCTGAVALGDVAAEAVGSTLPVGEADALALGGSDSLWTGALALGEADPHRVPLGDAWAITPWSLVHRTQRSPVPRTTMRSLVPAWPATVVQGPLEPNDQSKL